MDRVKHAWTALFVVGLACAADPALAQRRWGRSSWRERERREQAEAKRRYEEREREAAELRAEEQRIEAERNRLRALPPAERVAALPWTDPPAADLATPLPALDDAIAIAPREARASTYAPEQPEQNARQRDGFDSRRFKLLAFIFFLPWVAVIAIATSLIERWRRWRGLKVDPTRRR